VAPLTAGQLTVRVLAVAEPTDGAPGAAGTATGGALVVPDPNADRLEHPALLQAATL